MLSVPHTRKPTNQLRRDLLSFPRIIEDTKEDFIVPLMQLITKEPFVTNSFKLGPSALREYLYAMKDREMNHSTVMIMLKSYMSNSKIRKIVDLYENDVGFAREIIEYIDQLDGKNKVPYIWVLFQSLFKKMYGIQKWKNSAATRLVKDPTTMSHIKELENTWTGLKVYSGETNTNCLMYDKILKQGEDLIIDFKSIQEAEYRADLGGGLATPYISSLLGAEYITHDLNDPKERVTDPYIVIIPPRTMNLQQYKDLLAVQPFKEFNVYSESYPTEYNTYSIVSFGFLSSTVKTIDPADNVEHNHVTTTYKGVKQIIDLVAMGKEVHCLFYGRPTIKTYDNVIIQLKFKDHRCVSCDVVDRFTLKEDLRTILYGKINTAYIIHAEENYQKGLDDDDDE